jgi:hypothetical protein
MEDIREVIDPEVGKIYDSPKGKVIFQLAPSRLEGRVCNRCVFRSGELCRQLFCGDLGYFAPAPARELILDAFCKANCDGHPPRSTCESLGTCDCYDRFQKYIETLPKE